MNYATKQVGAHRGAPRLYFQTQQLTEAGFSRGERYEIKTTPDSVILTLNEDGALLVSGKGDGAKAVPVIDINSSSALAPFVGMAAVKVVFGKGTITISKLASEEAATARLKRLKASVAATVLTVAGLAFGGGILDHSAHAGLLQAGLNSKTVLVNEIDADLLEHASGANPVISKDTIKIAAPMQELIQDDAFMASLPRADVVVAGIPCSGASRAGKSKHGIEIMEDHAEVGHLAHAFLVLIQRLQPGIIVLENVPEYATSASASIIRSQLRDMGYGLAETVLSAQDFGAMENRNRWFLVAATKGITLDLAGLQPAVTHPLLTVADILDKRDDHTWGKFDYLKAKAITDKAAGKGFQMQIIDPTATKVPVLRKSYFKGGSTDPLLRHPTDPDLLRLFSGDEHARIKGVDPVLVEGLSNTSKHIVLGQGVAPGMIRALFQRIGECVKMQKTSSAVSLSTTSGYRLDRAVG